MKKILFTLACAAMVCACDARHNNAAVNNSESTTRVEQEDTDAMMAPDFTLNDIYGMPLTLSSFRGTYVVLDFWGSWCPWCIKGIPEMKKYYQKYSGKFEIIGIDCNDPVEKWKAAVANYDMPWKHVYNPKGSRLAPQGHSSDSRLWHTGLPDKDYHRPQRPHREDCHRRRPSVLQIPRRVVQVTVKS